MSNEDNETVGAVVDNWYNAQREIWNNASGDEKWSVPTLLEIYHDLDDNARHLENLANEGFLGSKAETEKAHDKAALMHALANRYLHRAKQQYEYLARVTSITTTDEPSTLSAKEKRTASVERLKQHENKRWRARVSNAIEKTRGHGWLVNVLTAVLDTSDGAHASTVLELLNTFDFKHQWKNPVQAINENLNSCSRGLNKRFIRLGKGLYKNNPQYKAPK